MTDSRNEITDSDLSAHYRAIADERTPERLDKQILADAGKALRSGSGWRDTWYRPLTLAATVGLAFAFVLQLGDLSLHVGPPDELAPLPTPASDAFRDAGRANQERFQELQMEAERSMQSTPEMMAPPTEAGDALSTTIDGNLQPTSPGCTDDERRSATTWWECIRELEKKGFRQAAEVELQDLLMAFPSFERPE